MQVVEQRASALQRANRMRSERAAVKRALKDRELSAAELLRAPRPCLLGVEAHDFLEWVPRVGPWKARSLLRGLTTSPSVTVFQLGDRRRQELADRVDERT